MTSKQQNKIHLSSSLPPPYHLLLLMVHFCLPVVDRGTRGVCVQHLHLRDPQLPHAPGGAGRAAYPSNPHTSRQRWCATEHRAYSWTGGTCLYETFLLSTYSRAICLLCVPFDSLFLSPSFCIRRRKQIWTSWKRRSRWWGRNVSCSSGSPPPPLPPSPLSYRTSFRQPVLSTPCAASTWRSMFSP